MYSGKEIKDGSDKFPRKINTFLLHYITLYYTILHNITLYYTPLHYITKHYTILHNITLYYTILHYITQHYTILHITLYYTILHYITQHYTLLHNITFQEAGTFVFSCRYVYSTFPKTNFVVRPHVFLLEHVSL